MIHVHLLGRILEITGGGIDRAPCKRTVQVPSVCTTDKVQACLAPGGRCRRGGSPAETDISNATLTVVHLRSILSDRPGRQAWPSAVVRSPADEHDPPGSWDLGGPLLIRLILLHLRAAATPSSATPKPRALRRQPMTRAGRSNTHVRGPNDWPTAAQTACMGRRMARPQTQEKKHPGSFVCFRPAASRLDCPGIWQAWGKPAQWRRREGGASRMHARPLTPRHTPPARTHARVAAECTRCHGPSAGLPESSVADRHTHTPLQPHPLSSQLLPGKKPSWTMHFSTVLVSALAATVQAAPAFPGLNLKDVPYPVNALDSMSAYFNAIAAKVQAARLLSEAPSCDLSKAQMPLGPDGLLPPAPGLTVRHVAVGRGTQNYTCDTGNATAVPKAAGAVATLFNASCVAALYPDVLDKIPSMAVHFNLTDDRLGPSVLQKSGVHYFTDATTAFFDLDTPTLDIGKAPCEKNSSGAAPSTASVGQIGEKAVPWLRLKTKEGATDDIKEVFRVTTAGGSAPATCKGMPATFEVQYASVQEQQHQLGGMRHRGPRAFASERDGMWWWFVVARRFFAAYLASGLSRDTVYMLALYIPTYLHDLYYFGTLFNWVFCAFAVLAVLFFGGRAMMDGNLELLVSSIQVVAGTAKLGPP
ncbi:hypothetical protein PCL_12341 [Purpureocillium lilacinum]|uniref:Uncharacterized protein n=1 Tax=Purpureocillium lilacinum TaxID=33203 RepID=A0A2U3E8Y5_PURLI|nr:hypothetical protein PCL_12341 [Purpureocillium lilacinum]